MSNSKVVSWLRTPWDALKGWRNFRNPLPDVITQARSALPTIDPSQTTILTHVVLIGLTPLIPIPFVDDVVEWYFQRRFVIEMAKVHSRELTAHEVAALAGDEGPLIGCWQQFILRPVRKLFFYPVKKLLRKIFWILEVRRAITVATHTYYHGHLLDYSLRDGRYLTGDKQRAWKVRAAVVRARKGANTRLVQQAIRESFSLSWEMMRDTARIFWKMVVGLLFRFRRPAFEEGMKDAQVSVGEQLARMVERLQRGLAAVPSDHLEELRDRLVKELEKEKLP